jgi:hypothetical protein
VPAQLKEPYGSEVPVSAMRAITEGHAAALHAQEHLPTARPARGVAWGIAAIDGSRIPLVDTADPTAVDPAVERRKTRPGRWQEARLRLAQAQGTVTPVFAAPLGEVDEVGAQLRDCALRAGLGKTRQVHGVGDGARWIAEQFQRVVAQPARSLVDFYPVCDSLAAAAPGCAPAAPRGWLSQQKEQLKQSPVEVVQAALAPYLEANAVADKAAPVRCCYRYLVNRPGQVDYQSAVNADLPLGSGEIESAHRYVIQQRLKLAGAWWNEDTAADLLALRTLRANGQWEQYWATIEQQAV